MDSFPDEHFGDRDRAREFFRGIAAAQRLPASRRSTAPWTYPEQAPKQVAPAVAAVMRPAPTRPGRKVPSWPLVSAILAGLFVVSTVLALIFGERSMRLDSQLNGGGLSAAPTSVPTSASTSPIAAASVPAAPPILVPTVAPAPTVQTASAASSSAVPLSSSSATVAGPATPSTLQPVVTSAFAGLPPGSSAFFQELSRTDHVERGSTTPVVAASLIKLPIVIEALRQESTGQLSATQTFTVTHDQIVGGTGILQGQAGHTLTLKQLMETTLVYSDNVGANMLIQAVGMDSVNNTIHTFGYTNTTLARAMMDTQAQQRGTENMVSAADVSGMLEKAYHGQLLTPSIGQEVLRILKLRGQRTEPTLDFMGRRLNPRPTLAHLNGELDGTRNDAGIIDTGSRAYILAILIHNPGHDQAAEDAIANASAAIYAAALKDPTQ